MIPRLYTQETLKIHALIDLDEYQTHYARNVLRLTSGSIIRLFNGKEGEWSASIKEMSKKRITLQCMENIRAQEKGHEVILIQALIKPARFAFLLEKVTELGITKILPVITDFTQIRKINLQRMQLQLIEASEQSERLSVPEISAPQKLHDVLAHLSSPVYWADETRDAQTYFDALQKTQAHTLLVGPEGGFSEKEKEYLRSLPYIIPVHLGPQILRAETAGIAMTVLYQAVQGTWRID